jgi:hypothetical protein
MEHTEIVQCRRHIGMILAMYSLIDLQRLKIDGFSLSVFTLSGIDLRQLRKADGHTTIFATEGLSLLHGHLKHVLGLCIVTLPHGLLAGAHDRFPGLLLTGGHHCGETGGRQ